MATQFNFASASTATLLAALERALAQDALQRNQRAEARRLGAGSAAELGQISERLRTLPGA